MSLTEQQVFCYPTGYGDLKSVEEYQDLYLPAMHDYKSLDLRLQKTIEIILPYQEKINKCLDYGCGGGVFVHHLAKKMISAQVAGWDGDFSSIEIAKSCFSLENTDFKLNPYTSHDQLEDQTVDGISFLEVIEHVDNPGEILRNFYRALTPNGYLLITTPNFLGWSAINLEVRRILNEFVGRRKRRGYVQLLEDRVYNPATEQGHITLCSAQTLTMLLKSIGFELVNFGLVPATRKVHHRLFPDTLIVLAQKKSM